MKLTKIDLELLEMHNKTVSGMEKEKREEIKETLKKETKNLKNLINDPLYLKFNSFHTYLEYIVKWLKADDIDAEIEQYFNSNHIDEYFILKEFKKDSEKIKKEYLYDLKKADNIKTTLEEVE